MIKPTIPDIKIAVPRRAETKRVVESMEPEQTFQPAPYSNDPEQTLAETDEEKEYLVLLGPKVYETLSKRVFIGSDENLSDIVLKDEFARYVSGRHCEIVKRQSGYYLGDCGSTNGTLLNGRKIRSENMVKIAPGDIVRIGTTDLHIERQ